MADVIKGGCLCGQVRYQTTCKESSFKVNCHCRDCQKLSGGPYVSLMGVPEASFSTSGKVTCFAREGGSGNKIKAYCCTVCNGRVYGRPEIAKGLILILASSLDDPDLYRPNADVFVHQALPWDRMDENLPKFEGAFQRGS
ncbi:GFA family protein [Kiloniella sp.]|uniref:GFA family protein n=1 Tax=Kiloniella sp. TaxID=1938587 RepID=UPI003B02041B